MAGLEKALNEETEKEVDLAIQRILLIHNIILTIGGIPLIYLGDEVGMLNDYRYRDDPAKREDTRWVHRLPADPQRYQLRQEPETTTGRIYQGLHDLIQRRKGEPAFSASSPSSNISPMTSIFGCGEASSAKLFSAACMLLGLAL